ncbi:hypothetical protein P7K49_040165 [Saguinus oedipus]|uniref:Skin secretory protein xP2-like n=1 Tax=Saguinus oedipus TaxID=9490 RepID=A0ABQ9T8H7_SAGOE|nr:hypothetical protein P7K49_040165 [Saguinus oedipus]
MVRSPVSTITGERDPLFHDTLGVACTSQSTDSEPEAELQNNKQNMIASSFKKANKTSLGKWHKQEPGSDHVPSFTPDPRPRAQGAPHLHLPLICSSTCSTLNPSEPWAAVAALEVVAPAVGAVAPAAVYPSAAASPCAAVCQPVPAPAVAPVGAPRGAVAVAPVGAPREAVAPVAAVNPAAVSPAAAPQAVGHPAASPAAVSPAAPSPAAVSPAAPQAVGHPAASPAAVSPAAPQAVGHPAVSTAAASPAVPSPAAVSLCAASARSDAWAQISDEGHAVSQTCDAVLSCASLEYDSPWNREQLPSSWHIFALEMHSPCASHHRTGNPG